MYSCAKIKCFSHLRVRNKQPRVRFRALLWRLRQCIVGGMKSEGIDCRRVLSRNLCCMCGLAACTWRWRSWGGASGGRVAGVRLVYPSGGVAAGGAARFARCVPGSGCGATGCGTGRVGDRGDEPATARSCREQCCTTGAGRRLFPGQGGDFERLMRNFEAFPRLISPEVLRTQRADARGRSLSGNRCVCGNSTFSPW